MGTESKLETKKNVVLPPIRVSSLFLDKIKARADLLYPTLKGRNVSKYLNHLIEEDLKNITSKNSTSKENKNDEIRFFSLQLLKIGNNLNQVAHSMNVIKKKKFINLEDKRNFDKHYIALSNIQKQMELLKDILKDFNKS